MKSVNAYIGVGSPWNNKTLSAIPGEILSARQRLLKPIQARRVDHTRWVITRYPTHSQAQDAGMSFEDFEDFYFRACNIDWRKESSRQQKLKLLLGRTKTVRLVAPDTDITLSIVGMPAIKCDGKRNMPDGEVFTAPLLHSARGIYVIMFLPSTRGSFSPASTLSSRRVRLLRLALTRGRSTWRPC